MGRKQIPRAIRLNFLIPMEKEKEVKEFINAIQNEAIKQRTIEQLKKEEKL